MTTYADTIDDGFSDWIDGVADFFDQEAGTRPLTNLTGCVIGTVRIDESDYPYPYGFPPDFELDEIIPRFCWQCGDLRGPFELVLDSSQWQCLAHRPTGIDRRTIRELRSRG